MHCNGHVARLPLHTLQLVNQVNHGPAVSGRCGLAPFGKVELADDTTLLRLKQHQQELTRHHVVCMYVCAYPPTLSRRQSLKRLVM